jgi:CheY-like chemotaxis protein
MSKLQRVLCVEDEQNIRTLITLSLETVGRLTVLTCASGEEALREAVSFAPEIILLDVMMPGMDGPSTLKALRQLTALDGVPVVFMTAKVQPHEIAQYKLLGACDVIAKPFSPMTLAEQVKAIWTRSASPN